MKATPLLLIALGLAVCFRSNVWNIGAEGQFVVGAIAAGGVAMLADQGHRPLDRRCRCWSPACSAAWLWAAIVALLRDRFNANEILVSLMLVYVAEHAAELPRLRAVEGPGTATTSRRPSPSCKSTQVPRLFGGFRVNVGADRRAGSPSARSGCCLFRTYARLPAAGRRPGAGGGALRRLLVAQGAVDRAAALGRHGRPGRRRSRSPGRSASSRRTCRPATASPRSSSPSSAGCIRWASSSRRS